VNYIVTVIEKIYFSWVIIKSNPNSTQCPKDVQRTFIGYMDILWMSSRHSSDMCAVRENKIKM